LKRLVQERKVWWPATADGKLRFFQKEWKPKCWSRKFRFLFIRRETALQQKGPIQLDLFEPQEWGYEFKVVVTNKTGIALKIVRFHEGRGQQENIFSELKDQANMDYLPSRSWAGNKIYLICAILAHNLGRELQMDASESQRGTTEKRSPLWIFEGLGVMRRKFLQRAGRLTRNNHIDHERQPRGRTDSARLLGCVAVKNRFWVAQGYSQGVSAVIVASPALAYSVGL
jgi:hypothetical protein